MKVMVYAAVSADGFIATAAGGTDWVDDWEVFAAACREFGCTVMGRKTFEEGGAVFEGVQHIVLSSQVSPADTKRVAGSPTEAVEKAKALGFDRLLVIGGGQTNGSFMRAGLVDEFSLDVHPLILGTGVRAFEGFDLSYQLRLLACKQYPAFIRLHYEVLS